MAAADEVDQLIEQYHLVAAEFIKGNAQPYKELFSHREDVSLANPFGPPVRGWNEAAQTMERAASRYSDGEIVGFENVAKYVTSELAYIVEVEGRILPPWHCASQASFDPRTAPGRWCTGTQIP
jgi:hypothetical protein